MGLESPWASLVPERVARLIARAAGARHLAVGHRLEAVALRAAARLDVGRLASVARRLAPRHGRRLALGAQPLARGNGAKWRAQAEEVVRVFAARPVAQEHLVAGRPHGDRAAAAHLAVGFGCACRQHCGRRGRAGCVHTTSAVLHQPHRGCVRSLRHTRKRGRGRSPVASRMVWAGGQKASEPEEIRSIPSSPQPSHANVTTPPMHSTAPPRRG